MPPLISNSSVYFFGIQGTFSYIALKTLYEFNIRVSHIYCASPKPAQPTGHELPVTLPENTGTLEYLANKHATTIQYISDKSDLLFSNKLPNESSDFILVACFPYHLPKSILQWPNKACLNIHPSLLPKYRGPDPIFWQLYNDEQETGVSLHLLTQELDTGPVIMQQIIPYGYITDYQQIESKLASTGVNLFVKLIETGTPLEKLLKKQNVLDATYYPAPSQNNFYVNPQWSARHAYNFIRGTRPPDGQFRMKIQNQTLILTNAIDYTNDGQLKNAYKQEKENLYIQLSPGILHVHGHCQI